MAMTFNDIMSAAGNMNRQDLAQGADQTTQQLLALRQHLQNNVNATDNPVTAGLNQAGAELVDIPTNVMETVTSFLDGSASGGDKAMAAFGLTPFGKLVKPAKQVKKLLTGGKKAGNSLEKTGQIAKGGGKGAKSGQESLEDLATSAAKKRKGGRGTNTKVNVSGKTPKKGNKLRNTAITGGVLAALNALAGGGDEATVTPNVTPAPTPTPDPTPQGANLTQATGPTGLEQILQFASQGRNDSNAMLQQLLGGQGAQQAPDNNGILAQLSQVLGNVGDRIVQGGAQHAAAQRGIDPRTTEENLRTSQLNTLTDQQRAALAQILQQQSGNQLNIKDLLGIQQQQQGQPLKDRLTESMIGRNEALAGGTSNQILELLMQNQGGLGGMDLTK